MTESPPSAPGGSSNPEPERPASWTPPDYGPPVYQPSEIWADQPAGPRAANPLQGFDPNAVHPLDWLILGVGLLTFGFSFAGYYRYTERITVAGFSESRTETWNAWHGVYGWLAAVAALAAAVVLAADLIGVVVSWPARLTVLAGFALALLLALLAMLVIPARAAFTGVRVFGIQTSEGHAAGFWVSLILVCVGTLLSLVRFIATGGGLTAAR